jgi:hypothetical protein
MGSQPPSIQEVFWQKYFDYTDRGETPKADPALARAAWATSSALGKGRRLVRGICYLPTSIFDSQNIPIGSNLHNNTIQFLAQLRAQEQKY